jgi:hypothetical protein
MTEQSDDQNSNVTLITFEYWNAHLNWSKTADRLKARRTYARNTVLFLTIIGAAGQTLVATATFLGSWKLIAGIVSAGALALTPLITQYFLTAEATQNWLRARSVSEGIKSELFSFWAKAGIYACENERERLSALIEKIKKIRGWGKNLEFEVARTPPSKEEIPAIDSANKYVELRVKEQIKEYYQPKAQMNAKFAANYRLFEFFLGIAAAILGAAATVLDNSSASGLGSWVAVLTTIAGGVAAHAAVGRFDFQASTFHATATELNDLVHAWQAAGRPEKGEEWSEFVRNCEAVISAENRGWMAKLDAADSGASASKKNDKP